MTTRSRVASTILLGAALILGVLVVVLLRVPDKVISTNSTVITEEVSPLRPSATVCQGGELIPASTAAIRMSLGAIAHPGPAISVTISRGGQIVSEGHRAGGWIGASLTVPLSPPVTRPISARICATRSGAALPVEIAGGSAPAAIAATLDGKPLQGRMRVEYLGHGQQSWLARSERVARRLGLGRWPSGTWIVLPLVAMMAGAIALGIWLLLREAST